MSRSVPLAKAMDDAILALYQNGERLRPENGYPMRLFLPGYEGNMNVKWLRRIKVTREPDDDQGRDVEVLRPPARRPRAAVHVPDGSEVGHHLARPAGSTMQGPGLYQISGLAWSGAGRIRRVEVSADGGQSWGEAALSEPRAAEGAHALPDGVALERRPRAS